VSFHEQFGAILKKKTKTKTDRRYCITTVPMFYKLDIFFLFENIGFE